MAKSSRDRRIRPTAASAIHGTQRRRETAAGGILPAVGKKSARSARSRRTRVYSRKSHPFAAGLHVSGQKRFRETRRDHKTGSDSSRRRPAQKRSRRVSGRHGHAQVLLGAVGAFQKALRGSRPGQSKKMENRSTQENQRRTAFPRRHQKFSDARIRTRRGSASFAQAAGFHAPDRAGGPASRRRNGARPLHGRRLDHRRRVRRGLRQHRNRKRSRIFLHGEGGNSETGETAVRRKTRKSRFRPFARWRERAAESVRTKAISSVKPGQMRQSSDSSG